MTNLPALRDATPGQIANTLAAASVFERYADEHADATLRQQERSLAAFARYLMPRGVRVDPSALARSGEALSHIRVYAELAHQSGQLHPHTHRRCGCHGQRRASLVRRCRCQRPRRLPRLSRSRPSRWPMNLRATQCESGRTGESLDDSCARLTMCAQSGIYVSKDDKQRERQDEQP